MSRAKAFGSNNKILCNFEKGSSYNKIPKLCHNISSTKIRVEIQDKKNFVGMDFYTEWILHD